MPPLESMLPTSEIACKLAPEELAGYLLELLKTSTLNLNSPLGTRKNLLRNVRGSSIDSKLDSERAYAETFDWLMSQGFISSNHEGSLFVTRRGQNVKSRADLTALRQAELLPYRMLHQKIADAAVPAFMRGEYELAIFAAFKAVEIEMRVASGLPQSWTGRPLAREAFKVRVGPLTDSSLEESEQLSLADLFAGAMGYCRNPTAHRPVKFTDVVKVVELIVFASHLMRLIAEAVDRKKAPSAP